MKGLNVVRISKTIETEDGAVSFDGELNADELDLIINIGLNHLLREGALPMRVMKQEDNSTVGPGTQTEQ